MHNCPNLPEWEKYAWHSSSQCDVYKQGLHMYSFPLWLVIYIKHYHQLLISCSLYKTINNIGLAGFLKFRRLTQSLSSSVRSENELLCLLAVMELGGGGSPVLTAEVLQLCNIVSPSLFVLTQDSTRIRHSRRL